VQRTAALRWSRVGIASLAALVVVAASPSAREQTPAASEIIARHVKAIGGAEAYKKIQSVKVTGRFEIAAQNLAGTMTVFQARPNRMLLRVELPGVGTILRGFDGKHGWSVDPMAGASLQAGRELTETKDEAWFDSTLYEPDHVKSFGTVAKLDFDGRPAYQFKITLQSGTESTDYFDAEHGYQIGSESSRETQLGTLPTVSIHRNYKPFGALRMPTLLVQKAMGIEQRITVETMEFDKVTAADLDPPAEIKALIKGLDR
jgi:hypothetical protein